MDLLLFIENHLRESKNFYCRRGQNFELLISQLLHQSYTPILISPKLVRGIGAGQVDVAICTADCVYLIECKSSCYPSTQQLIRLRRTQLYISHLVNRPVVLKVLLAEELFY